MLDRVKYYGVRQSKILWCIDRVKYSGVRQSKILKSTPVMTDSDWQGVKPYLIQNVKYINDKSN